jgi:hypothetical protein
MGGEYGTNRLHEDCRGFVAVINVGKIRLDVQGNTILNLNFQMVLSEFLWIRIDYVSEALCIRPSTVRLYKMRGIARATKQLFAFCEGPCSNEVPRHNIARVKGPIHCKLNCAV